MVVILLLNVVEVFSVGGGGLLDRPCVWSSRECACCACDPSVHLSVPSIGFCLCFCMSEVISSFKSLRTGSHVFSFPMLFLCVILHTIWSGNSLQLLFILPFGMLCLSVISMVSVKIMLEVCMVV